MQKVSFECDICGKEFTGRNEKGEVETVGGMNGFYEKSVMGEDKVLDKQVMQYNFDFCPECNKKMVDFYIKLGGK